MGKLYALMLDAYDTSSYLLILLILAPDSVGPEPLNPEPLCPIPQNRELCTLTKPRRFRASLA